MCEKPRSLGRGGIVPILASPGKDYRIRREGVEVDSDSRRHAEVDCIGAMSLNMLYHHHRA